MASKSSWDGCRIATTKKTALLYARILSRDMAGLQPSICATTTTSKESVNSSRWRRGERKDMITRR